MARLSPKIDVLRALFARSGNQCAFPECTQPIINNKNKFIGQVCHIEAAMNGGERYNPKSNDEYRRSYENLLILCYPHHIETDDVFEYPVEKLKTIKHEHEKLFDKSDFNIDETELIKLSNEMNKYWNDIELLNNIDFNGLAMEVDKSLNFLDIINNLYETINGIENLLKLLKSSDEILIDDLKIMLQKKGLDIAIFDDIPYYENPFINRNFELHAMGTPNWLQRLHIDIVHLEIKYWEEYLKINNDDIRAKNRFEKVKKTLKHYALNAEHID